MSSEPRDYLRHILAEVDFLLDHSKDLDPIAFAEDPVLQRAFVRSLEIIGEATKKLPADFRALHSSIDWRGMAGMRDRLIHDYLGVDYELVLDVVRHRVPKLREQLLRLLDA